MGSNTGVKFGYWEAWAGALLALAWLSLVNDAGAAVKKPVTFSSNFSSATVFRDIDKDGQPNKDTEPYTETNEQGRFVKPAKGPGRLFLTGGTHIPTGKPNTRLFPVPTGARSVGTLTALWQALLDRKLKTPVIRKKLNVAANTSLPEFKAEVAPASKPRSKALVTRDAQHETLVLFLKSLIKAGQTKAALAPAAAAAAGNPTGFAEDAAVGALADMLAAPGSSMKVDFSDRATVRALMDGALANLKLDFGEANAELVAVVTADLLNRPIESADVLGEQFLALSKAKYDGWNFLKTGDFDGFREYFFPAPTITGFSDDTGNDSTDHLTRDDTPTLTGIAGPGTVAVRIYRDGTAIAPDLVPDAEGRWSYTSPALSDGSYPFTVTGLFAANYQSAPSAPLAITVDTTPAAAPSVEVLSTTLATPTLSGHWSGVSGDSLEVTLNGTSYGSGSGLAVAGTGWTLAVPTPLSRGTYEIVVTERDVAGNSSIDQSRNELAIVNAVPVARAGSNQQVSVGATVSLSGIQSSDANGDALGYGWVLAGKPAGSAAVLTGPDTATPGFVADKAGAYSVQLWVSDGLATSLPATVTVTTMNAAPQAKAGTAPTVHVGSPATLNGSLSRDPDGDSISYAWSVTAKPAGATVNLSGATTATPGFSTDKPGSYAVQLVVNDGQLNSAPALLNFTTANSAPVAAVAASPKVQVGSAAPLDGSGSADIDGDPLSYNWSVTAKPAGATAGFTGATTATPDFTTDTPGSYTLQLVVNDGKADSAAVSLSFTTTNSAPIAHAGNNLTGTTGAAVALNGVGTDVDGDPLNYVWVLVPPAGSGGVSLSSATAAAPSFVPDVHGRYVAQLIVNDGKVNSATASVAIDVAFSGKVGVSVNASDPGGKPLHYRWKVSEGSIEDVDAAATTWTLPPGPGVHFANVLIYNGEGGYASRRIAVISDNLGTSATAAEPRDFTPPANGGPAIAYDTEFLVTGTAAAGHNLGRAVYLAGFNAVADFQGRLAFTDVGHCDVYCGDIPAPIGEWDNGHPHTHSGDPAGTYLVGSASLADGHPCGIEDGYFGIHARATATAVDAAKNALGASVAVNAWGDYALPYDANAAFVLLECEGAVPVYAPVNQATGVAAAAVFPMTAVPHVSPASSTMTARVEGKNAGIYLPPELGQPSDAYPSGDLFLAFKGIDSQQAACEYYRLVGAVESCDAQGNPAGAITFDDWKHKVGLDPWLQNGAQEVDATYVNRIDLNLTRRHHAVSYSDGTGPAFASARADTNSSGCGIAADKSIRCWGGLDNLLAGSAPTGSFVQVDRMADYACALKEADGSVVCWGSFGAARDPAPGESFNQISVFGDHGCGLRADGSALCWNWDGAAWTSPSGQFSQISSGNGASCGISLTDASLNCWASNGAFTSPPAGSYLQLSLGNQHGCAVTTANAIACWGSDVFAATAPPDGNFSQVAVGDAHGCALQSDGTLNCWGDNTLGQTAAPIGTYSQLVGANCALDSGGRLACWGTGAPDFGTRVAAYVCNYLGPQTDSQADIDAAIGNAMADRNLVACVAMDYGRHDGAAVLPYVRYYVFAPNGQLMLSINLDGRQEKYVPGTCVACHGGDKYDGRFPADGTASPDYGGHFLPYDTGNFAFSSQPGLTKTDQQAAIHQLNQFVLKTNAGEIERTLINAWYAAGTDVLDEDYWPADWKAVAGTIPGADVEHLYKNVHARYCRTCHVALERYGSYTMTQNSEAWATWESYPQALESLLCGGSPWLQRNHTMPNSLVTFNRFWNDAYAVRLVTDLLGPGCAASNRPDPKITDPFANPGYAILPTSGAVGVPVNLDGSHSSSYLGAGVLSYQWTLLRPVGSSAALSDRTAANPSFTPDVAGTYIVMLVVNDGSQDSLPAQFQIRVRN